MHVGIAVYMQEIIGIEYYAMWPKTKEKIGDGCNIYSIIIYLCILTILCQSSTINQYT